jgi:hypothetical protein
VNRRKVTSNFKKMYKMTSDIYFLIGTLYTFFLLFSKHFLSTSWVYSHEEFTPKGRDSPQKILFNSHFLGFFRGFFMFFFPNHTERWLGDAPSLVHTFQKTG